MIVCINPSIKDLEENLHVLKFAELSQDVMVKKSEPVPTVLTTKKTIRKQITAQGDEVIQLQRRDAKIAMLEEENARQAMKGEELQNVVSTLHKIISWIKRRLNKGWQSKMMV